MPRKKKKKVQMCLYPGSNKPAVARGLSANYYGVALRQVNAGKVTWEELEAQGKALPPSGGCVKKHTPAQQWFTSKSKNKPVTKEPKAQIENKLGEEPKFMMVRNEDTIEAEERNHLQLVHSETNRLMKSQLSRLTRLYTDTHSIAVDIKKQITNVEQQYEEIKNEDYSN